MLILIFVIENNYYCDYLIQSVIYIDIVIFSAIFDLSRSNIAEIYFITDASGTGRGFTSGFTQIPCWIKIINQYIG